PVVAAPDTGSAVLAAQAQGARVEVSSLRTPTRTVLANPDGSLTAELSVTPTRVRRGGSWGPVDRTIAPRGDGTIRPPAGIGDLALSGGGSKAPLASLTKDGKRFALFWPGTLPAPKLDGDAATYPEVLPGVDLTMRATPMGYQQELMVKSAEAARSPALAEI